MSSRFELVLMLVLFTCAMSGLLAAIIRLQSPRPTAKQLWHSLCAGVKSRLPRMKPGKRYRIKVIRSAFAGQYFGSRGDDVFVPLPRARIYSERLLTRLYGEYWRMGRGSVEFIPVDQPKQTELQVPEEEEI